jgi:NADP-dependent 3-hydroxy acid dehydrogenase YdfG
MTNPCKFIVVVTGVGMRKSKKIFSSTSVEDLIELGGKKFKMNSSAGVAVELSKYGHFVYMLGSNETHMKAIGDKFLKENYTYAKINLLDKKEVQNFVAGLERLKLEKNLDVHLVHYGGASETNVKLPKDNLFLPAWEAPSEAIGPLVSNNTVTCLNVLQSMRKIFGSQKKSKVIVISAVASVRPSKMNVLDSIQKGAVHNMLRALALDLTKENIFVTEVMPGITDTGFYDSKKVLNSMVEISKNFGYDYKDGDIPTLSPRTLGKTVLFVINSDAHVREISVIPYNQFPHLGS